MHPAGFSTAILWQGAFKNIRTNWVDERNLKIMGRAKSNGLMVPIALMDVAERICKTELRPGTADNDVNVVRGGLTEGRHIGRNICVRERGCRRLRAGGHP